MLDVAVWGKFPPSFEQKISDKLQKYGVRVVRRLRPSTKEADLSAVDTVLFLHEYASHAESDRLRVLAKQNGKKIIALSRKEAFWARDLEYVLSVSDTLDSENNEESMGTKCVGDENIEAFCDKYMELRESGVSHEKMVPILGKFWQHGKLTNNQQLSQFVRHLAGQKRAPQRFVQYMNSFVRKAPPEGCDAEQVALDDASEDKPSAPARAIVSLRNEANADSNGKSAQEVPDLISLYEEEIKTLEAKIARLESDLSNVRSASEPNRDNKLIAVVKNVMESMELGLCNDKEALEKISRFYRNIQK